MSNREIDKIDWDQLWKDELKRVNVARIDWDERERALEFERQYSRTDYRDKMLDRVQTDPDCSVLDVGCGPGNLAVPLAARARNVTALDKSKEMLRLGKEAAAARQITNINFIQLNWDDVVIWKDIQPHDVVICSRAFSNMNPRESLLKLHAAAKKTVYLTLSTANDNAKVFYRKFYQEIGKEYRTGPDYIYGYNLLYQMGIQAHVDFIDYTDSFRYEKAEVALQKMSFHLKVETREQKDKLMSFIMRNMEKNNGFKLDLKCRWALLWWQK